MVASRNGRLETLRARYSVLASERFHAMSASRKFRQAQVKWLGLMGLRRPFPSIDEWADREGAWRASDPLSISLSMDVHELSSIFSVAPWHVVWGMLVSGHDPAVGSAQMFPVDVWHPKARIVLTGEEAATAEDLCCLASEAGIYVDLLPRGDLEQQEGQRRAPLPIITVELPLEFPPELACLECRHALGAGRDILRRAGMPVPLRSRSGTTEMAMCSSLLASGLESRLLAPLSSACSSLGLALRFDVRSGPEPPGGLGPLSSVRLEVQFPPTVKAELLVHSVKHLIKVSRLALKSVGLDLGKRLRPSPLAQQTRGLRVDGQGLPKRGLGDIAESQLGAFPARSGRLTLEGATAIGLVKSRRGKVKSRLIRKGLLAT